MAEVRLEERIEAPAQRVWDLLADFAGIDRWFPGATKVEVEGEGVGAVRTIPMGSSVIRERLERLDEAGRSLSYSIVEAPLPIRDYLATISVRDAGPDACTVHWVTRFEPVGAPEDQLSKGLEGAYRSGLQAIAKLASDA